MMIKKLIFSFFLFFYLLTISAVEPIKLGLSAVFSGPSQNLGIEYTAGAKLLIDKVNSEGGINGRLLELVLYDDTYNPLPCIYNTTKLIEHDNVDLLFNYVGTPTTNAILPLLKIHEDKDIVLFGNLSGAGGQRSQPYDRYVYNIRASYQEETYKLVEYFFNKGQRKIGIIYQIDGYGRSGFVGVKNKLNEYNSEIVAEASYSRGQVYNDSMKIQVEHLKKYDLDAIISVGSYEACAAFIRDSRELGLNIPIANISFVGTESLIDILVDQKVPLENLIFSEVVPSYLDNSYPVVKEYNKLREDSKLDPSFISLEGYINAKVLISILENTKLNIKRSNINKIIQEMHFIDIGLKNKLKFNNGSNQLLHNIYLYKLDKYGKLEEIK